MAANRTPTLVPHLTVAERVARGKAARADVPRSSHALHEAQSSRTGPLELLEHQAQTRVHELVPIRYGRMPVSPFTFYRGAAKIMANELAGTPRSGSAEIDQLLPEAMCVYGKLCGWTLARAHARTGDRIAIASYLGNGPSVDRAIFAFADAYADQNESDHQQLINAVKSGTIVAQSGV